MAPAATKAPAREPFYWTALSGSIIGGLSLAYLIQAATPLRLDDDAVDYLRVAAAITDGVQIPTLPIPLGYSRLLSLLERIGIATSATFVIVNCVFILIGLYSVSRLSEYSVKSRQFAIIGALLAIPVMKSAVIALPDAVFFGVSLLAVWCLSLADTQNRIAHYALIAIATILTAAAISLRYAGIALIPALAWSLVRRSTRRELAAFVFLFLALIAIAATSRIFFMYVSQARGYYAVGPDQLLDRVAVVVRSFGEVMLNVPFSRLRTLGALFITAGALFAAVLIALARRRAAITPARIYVISYLSLLIVWPFPTPRLWIPMIPLIFAEGVEGFLHAHRSRWMTVAAGTYAGWLTLTGVAALAYTTRISLSGERFPQLYGRSGGMADPTIKEGHRSYSRAQFYNEEARRMLARYGRR